MSDEFIYVDAFLFCFHVFIFIVFIYSEKEKRRAEKRGPDTSAKSKCSLSRDWSLLRSMCIRECVSQSNRQSKNRPSSFSILFIRQPKSSVPRCLNPRGLCVLSNLLSAAAAVTRRVAQVDGRVIHKVKLLVDTSRKSSFL